MPKCLHTITLTDERFDLEFTRLVDPDVALNGGSRQEAPLLYEEGRPLANSLICYTLNRLHPDRSARSASVE